MEEDIVREELLKIDRRGRVRYTRHRREMLLDEFERCGVSAWEFASTIGVNYTTFAGWRQQRKRERAQSGSASDLSLPQAPALQEGKMHWVEAVVDEPAIAREPVLRAEPARRFADCAAKGVHVHLPGGAGLEIEDAAQAVLVAALLRALEAKGAPAC